MKAEPFETGKRAKRPKSDGLQSNREKRSKDSSDIFGKSLRQGTLCCVLLRADLAELHAHKACQKQRSVGKLITKGRHSTSDSTPTSSSPSLRKRFAKL